MMLVEKPMRLFVNKCRKQQIVIGDGSNKVHALSEFLFFDKLN